MERVQSTPVGAESEWLATEFCIKALLLLSALHSLSFLTSFPYDFMHLIWANLTLNLILLWTGKFKDLDHDGEEYVLAPMVWDALGEATFEAGKTIPAAFGSWVLNIASERAQMIADVKASGTSLHLKIKLENGVIVKQRFSSKDLLLTRYYVKVKLRNYRWLLGFI